MSLEAALEHLAEGRWQAAHDIVHGDESPLACWTHAVVHLQEGDVDNARYWFGRAGRRFSADAKAELAALTATVARGSG
ncbi:MAG TPA: hypothetical protein VHJ20_24860 [Polyangia bacterium]|nr:hypothetical protein [Polyangia bacterium]